MPIITFNSPDVQYNEFLAAVGRHNNLTNPGTGDPRSATGAEAKDWINRQAKAIVLKYREFQHPDINTTFDLEA